MTQARLFATHALLPDGWARDVLFEVSANGDLEAVTPNAQPGQAERARGTVLPGLANAHSHAFQRAMAGLTEYAGPTGDNFWTWRELMYRFLRRLQPAQVEAIATQLYVEMLKAGYTAVGEFHYLHNDRDGRPYNDVTEMSRRILAAAASTGIGLTLMPVLYGYGNFGGKPATDGQRRFLNDPEGLMRIVSALHGDLDGDPQVTLGLAPHSLRAVTPETLTQVLDGFDALAPRAPVHIHVAEQNKEVQDCIDWSGERPVEWLLHHTAVGPRWCLVHATHVTDEEARGVAASGAVVSLCPTTEANLGDGVFPATDFLAAGGHFAIGSDSHVSISPIEELRWLEYGQRLTQQRRNLLTDGAAAPSVGRFLFDRAAAGSAQAMGRPISRLAAGCRADLLVLDDDGPILASRSGDRLLDALIFAGNTNPVRDVMVGGRWVVRDRHHAQEEAALTAYRSTLAELLA